MRDLRTSLIASLLLAACSGDPGGSSPTPEPPAQPPPGVEASLSVSDGSGAAGPYRLQDVRSLRVQVELRGLREGSHRVRIDVVSPRGTLYAQLPTAVEVGPSGTATALREVPVRGTSIERLRRTGRWAFQAYLDEGAAPATAGEVQVVE